MIEYRIMEPEEYPELPLGGEVLTPENSKVLVAVEDGEIVAIMGHFAIMFIDPIWVKESHRGSSDLLSGMTDKSHELLRSMNVEKCYTIISDDDPRAQRVAERWGAYRIEGKHMYQGEVRNGRVS